MQVSGSVLAWEEQLRMWQPAVSGPALYPTTSRSVESTGHLDFIAIAYHREALEVNHTIFLQTLLFAVFSKP